MSGDDSENDPINSFEEFMKGLLGDAAGEQAAHAMRERGFDMQSIPNVFGNPDQSRALLGQLQYLMNSSSGPVNWPMAIDLAKQGAYVSGEPHHSSSPTAAQAARARAAMQAADLWLDPVTSFTHRHHIEREVWSRTEWIDHTIDMWKQMCEPVAENVARALSDALTSQMGDATIEIEGIPSSIDGTSFPGMEGNFAGIFGQTQDIIPRLAAMVFAVQIGHALSALAQESMGSTDVGLPLAGSSATALVVRNIEAFTEGLDIPFEEIEQFMAVREAAHQRLFSSVPWLARDLLRAVEKYSAEIAIDTGAISEIALSIDPSDPSSFNQSLGGQIFSSEPTQSQQAALERLETLLAMVEGWVEVVTAHAIAAYLPHAEQLRELMRRRRATGSPAEQMLGSLIGLSMRPRRARGAASLFSLVGNTSGPEGRENLWRHPDLIPQTRDLDDPDGFLDRLAAEEKESAHIDRELSAMLKGTLGWAEGLSPDDDPELESLQKAGLIDIDPQTETHFLSPDTPNQSSSGSESKSADLPAETDTELDTDSSSTAGNDSRSQDSTDSPDDNNPHSDDA